MLKDYHLYNIKENLSEDEIYSLDMMSKTKSFLSLRFEMKDMGPATYVLEIKITRNRNTKLLYLDQENYLEKYLRNLIWQNQEF